MNNQLDYIVGQELIKLIKKNIGVTVKEQSLHVLLESKNKKITIPKELNSVTREVIARYR